MFVSDTRPGLKPDINVFFDLFVTDHPTKKSSATSLELKRIRKDKNPEVEKTMVMSVKEAARPAEERQVNDDRRKPRAPFR
ncbi:MAG: hypothetical protein JO093_14080 [Acidobacteria bacterium]|nr:hypothetical protein [Acidobacteriota bacterium]MBV9068596.1 hypothetical protein [Acidobacteriota bacterium]MBV9186744.1 hypothetical protein [Acidobacteriota bacterium]